VTGVPASENVEWRTNVAAEESRTANPWTLSSGPKWGTVVVRSLPWGSRGLMASQLCVECRTCKSQSMRVYDWCVRESAWWALPRCLFAHATPMHGTWRLQGHRAPSATPSTDAMAEAKTRAFFKEFRASHAFCSTSLGRKECF
jgi:hypothetical protein